MITVTIVVTPTMSYVDYRVSSIDVLEFIGNGIEVYVRRSRTVRYNHKRQETVSYLALLVAQEHHIPAMSVRRVNVKPKRTKKRKISDKQLTLL